MPAVSVSVSPQRGVLHRIFSQRVQAQEGGMAGCIARGGEACCAHVRAVTRRKHRAAGTARSKRIVRVPAAHPAARRKSSGRERRRASARQRQSHRPTASGSRSSRSSRITGKMPLRRRTHSTAGDRRRQSRAVCSWKSCCTTEGRSTISRAQTRPAAQRRRPLGSGNPTAAVASYSRRRQRRGEGPCRYVARTTVERAS